jgi:hypothetical protein
MELQNLPDIHLLSFGGGGYNYRRAVRRIMFQAESSTLFKTLIGITDNTFHKYYPEAWQKHKNFMRKESTGYGCWVWKPLLISKRLSEIPYGEILVYLDSGCELNLQQYAPIKRMHDYTKYVNEYGSLAMQLFDGTLGMASLKEKHYSKKMLVLRVNPSLRTLEENQLSATAIFLQKNDSNIQLVKDWCEIAIENQYCFLNGKQEDDETNGFKAHRYDQSIFSMLYKEAGKFYIQDETYWSPDWKTKGKNFPIWAMRNRSGISLGAISHPDSIDKFYAKTHNLSKIVKSRLIK